MQITQDATVQADPTLSAAVAEKDRLLETAINGAAAQATWELNCEGRWPNLTLRLRDRTGSRSSATFPAVLLKNEDELTSRLGSLKAALLKVAEWRKAVAAFFGTIHPWCESLPGNPVVTEEPIRVVEGPSGEYEATQFVVAVNNQEFRIRPVAAWVVGFDGMVEVAGPADRAMLYYTRATDSWCHIPNYLPYRELPLTESLFRELVEACLYE